MRNRIPPLPSALFAGDEYVHLLSRMHYVLGAQYPLSAVASCGLYKWKDDRNAQVSANLGTRTIRRRMSARRVKAAPAPGGNSPVEWLAIWRTFHTVSRSAYFGMRRPLS